jgi:hypothetical protein
MVLNNGFLSSDSRFSSSRARTSSLSPSSRIQLTRTLRFQSRTTQLYHHQVSVPLLIKHIVHISSIHQTTPSSPNSHSLIPSLRTLPYPPRSRSHSR